MNLGDIITVADSEKCGNREFPVLSMTMHDGLVLQTDRFKKAIASKDLSGYKVVRRNQLVVSFPIDEGVLYIQDVVDAGIVSPAYAVWDVRTDMICPKFLGMFLRCPKSIQYYKAKLRGSTARRRTIPRDDFLAMGIPDLSISDQDRICAILEKIGSVIAASTKQIDLLEELVKSRFVEMFGDPMTNPKRWPITSIGENISFLTSGSRGWAKYYAKTGKTFITIKNVKNARIILDDVQRINPPEGAEAERTKVQQDDLLISITADLGRTGVVSKELADEGAYINQHLSCVRLDKNHVVPLFVAYFLESSAGKAQFDKKNQSAVKAGLNFDAIKSLRFYLPPLTLQREFAAFVAKVDKLAFAARQRRDVAKQLYRAKIQEFFG